jgi:drug/metabolite transporter (DMT)-like permease
MNENKSNSRFLSGILISMLGALCFSSKAIFVKLGYRDATVDPMTLLAVRMMVALPFFLVNAFITGLRKKESYLPAKIWIWIFLTGCLGYYISSLLDFAGLQYVSAGLERLILFIYPTFVMIISSFIFGEKIKRNQWIAAGVTYAGILFAFFGEYNINISQQNIWTGAVFIFLCAITFGSYIVASSRIIPVAGAARFNSYSMISASAGVLLHYFIFGEQPITSVTQSTWIWGSLMGIFSTVIPSYLVTESINRIGGENTAIIASLGPVSTMLMAWLWLDEGITPWQISGTLCIISGIIIVARVGRDKSLAIRSEIQDPVA